MLRAQLICLSVVLQAMAQDYYHIPPNILPSDPSTRRTQYRQRPVQSEETRGQSFGLEKYISPFSYEDTDEFRSIPQRTKKPKGTVRGQTYGLENISPQLFQFPEGDSAEINIEQEGSFDMKKTNRQERRPATYQYKDPVEPQVRQSPFPNLFQHKEVVETQARPATFQYKDPVEYPTVSRFRDNFDVGPEPTPNFYDEQPFLPTIVTERNDPTPFPTVEIKPPKKIRMKKPVENRRLTIDRRPAENKRQSEERAPVEDIKPVEERRPLERPSTFQTQPATPATVEPVTAEPTVQYTTPRPRKRMVLRRRKKKPQPEQVEESSQPPQIEEEQEQQLAPTVAAELPEELTKAPPSSKNEVDTNFEEKQVEVKVLKPKRKRPSYRQPAEERSTTQVMEEHQVETSTERVLQEVKDIERETNTITRKMSRKKDVTTESVVTEPPPVQEEVTVQPSAHQLKTILKQQPGTLSLSEILQTQNLSLTDFLRGNRGAISALGGKKVEEPTTPRNEYPTTTDKRHRLPKISPKSRPFSKNPYDTKLDRYRSKLTETTPTPRTLDVEEVTTEKSYNGFQPKNPRLRFNSRVDKLPKTEVTKKQEEVTESIKNAIKNVRESSEELPKGIKSLENEAEVPVKPTKRLRTQGVRFTTASPSTTTEQRVVPKRFGDMRPKLRIDRRKPPQTTTEEPTTLENIEVVSTEKVTVPTTEKPIVRIPFMSANNPDLPLILQSRNRTNVVRNRDRLSTLRGRSTEKPEKEAKAIESHERTDNSIYSKLKFKAPSKAVLPNTFEEVTRSVEVNTVKIEQSTKTSEFIEEEDEDDFDYQRETTQATRRLGEDEIGEHLKSGSNAQKLSKILAARNMTLSELLEKRERGTTQINFEDLFEAKEGAQPTIETTTHSSQKPRYDGVIHRPEEPKVFSSFPEFKIDPKLVTNIKPQDSNEFDELFADESVSSSIKLKTEDNKAESRDPRVFGSYTRAGPRNVQLNLTPSTGTKTPIPVWNVDEKSIYNSHPHGYPDNQYHGRGIVTTRIEDPPPKTSVENTKSLADNDIILLETINRTAEINHNLKNSIDEILKESSESTEEYVEKTVIPPAVKSAIIASGVVLGIALVLFIAIFVACGCRQRQIRIRGKASILNESLSRSNSDRKAKRNTLSPMSFKRSGMYRKALDFEETASSVSNSSNASSYLWNTLRNTFTSRNNTLKNMKTEESLRQDSLRQDSEKRVEEERRNTLRKEEKNPVRRIESQERKNTLRRNEEDRGIFTKIDPDRNIINTSLSFKRGGSVSGSNRYNTCAHISS